MIKWDRESIITFIVGYRAHGRYFVTARHVTREAADLADDTLSCQADH